MPVCRHDFHNGVMAHMLHVGERTIHRIFVAWVVFMEAIFPYSNLKPDDEFLFYRIPEVFNKTVHGLTYIIIA